MLIAMIESCFEFLLPETLRMVVNACALVSAEIFYDEQVRTIDAAKLLKVDVAQLKAAEHVVISVLLQTSHPSGHRIAPTAYALPLISSYETYAPACTILMRELVATHIAGSWRRTLAVRMRLARRAGHVAARPATNKLAAKLAAAAKLATAAIAMQRAYRKAALAKTASPICIMSWPSRREPVAFEEVAFGLDSKDHATRGGGEGGGGEGGAGGYGESSGAGNGGGGTSGGCNGYGTGGGITEAAAARAAARVVVIRARPSPLLIEGPPPCRILLRRLIESMRMTDSP
jgi:uncharacterized membrane protein YgcG